MTTQPRSLPLLDRIAIASPCSARWEDMSGDDKRRFCSHCSLHVHNLSAMTREEAESLLTSADGRLCTRLYKRADGTVLTQDCPVGFAAARVHVRRVAARIGAALGLASAATAAGVSASHHQVSGPIRLRGLSPFARLAEWIAPAPPPTPITVTPNYPLMGKVCFTPSPPAPTPTNPPPGNGQ